MDNITHILNQLGPYLPFIMIMAIVALFMYRAHMDDNRKFTVFDLIEDPITGKGSLEKIALLIAILAMTWWFIDMAAAGKLTNSDVGTYGGLLGGSKIFNSFITSKYTPPSYDPTQQNSDGTSQPTSDPSANPPGGVNG